MDLTKFDFPKVTDVDLAFPTFRTIPELLEEAKKRGYYNGNLPGNKKFSTLFYSGGKPIPREGLDLEFAQRAWPYCRALMGSFAPKHEEKNAVCAMLLDELLSGVQELEEKK